MEELNTLTFYNEDIHGISSTFYLTEIEEGVEIEVMYENDNHFANRWFHLPVDKIDEVIEFLEQIKKR